MPFLSAARLPRARYRGAHFWGFVGFLIKGAAVTPTARMRGIVRGISSKNLSPFLSIFPATRFLSALLTLLHDASRLDTLCCLIIL